MSRNEGRAPARAGLVALLALALLGAGAARSEVRQFGQYEVHYSLFASDFLLPEVAANLGIVRAKDRAVLNIAVRRREPGAREDRPVEATPDGTRSDLLHATALEFVTVREPGAIYHLAQFPFRNGERLYFDLRIVLEGESLELRFDKTLYVD